MAPAGLSAHLEEVIKVRAYLQRNPGSTTVRLWFVPRDNPRTGWFHEMNFDKVLREEIATSSIEGANRPWSAFEASFFGPQLQELEALGGDFDETLLNQQLTRGTPPDLSALEPAGDWNGSLCLQETALA